MKYETRPERELSSLACRVLRSEGARQAGSGAPSLGTILVVDGEQAVRDVIARVLERLGYHVYAVADGQAATELLKGIPPPTVALIDLTATKTPGLLVAQAIHERCPATPLVLMSGFDSEEIRRLDTAGLANALLQKPFTMRSVQQMLDQVLGSR